MEKYVGNQRWGQWPMQLARFHCTKKMHEESIQECKTFHTCSSGTIGKSFMQQCNEKDSNIDLSSASCTIVVVVYVGLAAWFFKLSSLRSPHCA